MSTNPIQTVVMTGAAGGVARRIRPLLADAWPRLVLSDRVAPPDLRSDETFVPADLADLTAMEHLLAGADGLIHLAGHSTEGSWDVIHNANILGLQHTFEAARRQGVKRIVFASSSHAVGFYGQDESFDEHVLPRPDTRYAVSKLFGEALGSLYARKYGIRIFSIRIGSIAERPVTSRRLSKWLHPEDFVQLVRIGLSHPDIVDDVVYGISACERAWWDNGRARALGYRPRHRAEDHRDAAVAADATLAPDPVGDRFQGGGYCSEEFSDGLAASEPAIVAAAMRSRQVIADALSPFRKALLPLARLSRRDSLPNQRLAGPVAIPIRTVSLPPAPSSTSAIACASPSAARTARSVSSSSPRPAEVGELPG